MPALDYTLATVTTDNEGRLSDQIARLIIKNIERNNISSGDKLPTERELSEHLSVSRVTVKTAYQLLAQQGIISSRQGSGSFVKRDEALAQQLRNEQAAHMLGGTVAALAELGITAAEMTLMFEACLAQNPKSTVRIALVFGSVEALVDVRNQLSHLPNTDISVFIMESIAHNSNPEELLRNFDIIVTPAQWYETVVKLLPTLTSRVVRAAVSQSNDTIIGLTSLQRDARIGVICRSNYFLKIVKGVLNFYGFATDEVQTLLEVDYTTKTHFPGGIDALIAFPHAHIFTNPDFQLHCEELLAKGVKIIAFDQHVEKGTFIYIEDCVHEIMAKNS
ncbi:MAG: GntR family transcriptional regulator [Oscillospiraceae bacterium]|nr:GntR family transcriptional regulator [Oscillospiraceae bacterium]